MGDQTATLTAIKMKFPKNEVYVFDITWFNDDGDEVSEVRWHRSSHRSSDRSRSRYFREYICVYVFLVSRVFVDQGCRAVYTYDT